MNHPFSIRHVGHSSVITCFNGQYLEVRRGSLRHIEIPNPCMWNSIQEWYASIPYIYYDLAQRHNPDYFNAEQCWMAQWHEYSTLDDAGQYYDPATILVHDAVTSQLIPLFMNLDTGVMLANGIYFAEFAQTPFQINQVWRLELGNYYRIY
jgi:hypothetical protein